MFPLFIFALVFIYSKFGPGLPINSTSFVKQDTLTVSGEGKVSVIPDTAIVNLGITKSATNVKTAQSEANKVINDTIAATKNLGIESKDIKTSNYTIYPQYDYQSGISRITNYQVNASLTITVRDLNKLNTVIDTATASGANTISGINLTVDESKQKTLLQEARVNAISEAKAKATSLAQAANISLGRIVNIMETPQTMYNPQFKMRSADMGGGGAADTNIQPGSTDISTSVTLFYETR